MNKPINCLMLKTIDQRCFFTRKNYFPQLIEFAKTCKAEISVVKGENIKVLELPELVKSICNHSNLLNESQYEIIEVKLLESSRSRKELLQQANIISSQIEQAFLDRKVVSLKDLETEFPKISKSALSNHITRVRNRLSKNGLSVTRVKAGQYILS